jgi:uncharacterized protein (DUF1501 family)
VKAFLATLDELQVRDRASSRRCRSSGGAPRRTARGTDHGAAAAHFVLGRPVKGGRHGGSIARQARFGREPPATVDYRTYDATLLGWLDPGFDREAVLDHRAALPIF